MNSYDVKRFALALSIQAEIEGMKALNTEREQRGYSIAYREDAFVGKAEDLRILASKHDNEL